RTLEKRQGMQTGCPEEIAFEQGWIDRAAMAAMAEKFAKNDYGKYLKRLLD
ncbi:glucose-1-phosphate thymidylyltransferase, partial [Seohaeicola sp. SP36]|nr:glucose-1-phosphate thymidylyltransferase [Seohaeicola sp. 4SK31]MDD9736968.1 glucose-1-phosphate thymidylyltransferase [Seohaeicola sp. SP36]